TLGICFDPGEGVLEMKGVSYPENAARFFQPLHSWLETYISEIGNPVTLNLKFNYLNSTSTKHMFDFLETLESFHEAGRKVKVNWYYEESEYSVLEMGEDFAEDMNLQIELVSY
ncbi:MAG TPA: DUF1987 domain-containing protein, partial [Desulfobacterales bacterium]|nr:DUF1987 domain-containing protein [Desulfobacterales bacterium]